MKLERGWNLPSNDDLVGERGLTGAFSWRFLPHGGEMLLLSVAEAASA